MKKLILLSFVMFSLKCFSQQEVKSKQSSSLPNEVAYFVNGKFFLGSDLTKIPYDSILSVDVIKRDTIINQKRYDAQIFVLLKTKEEESNPLKKK